MESEPASNQSVCAYICSGGAAGAAPFCSQALMLPEGAAMCVSRSALHRADRIFGVLLEKAEVSAAGRRVGMPPSSSAVLGRATTRPWRHDPAIRRWVDSSPIDLSSFVFATASRNSRHLLRCG